MAPQSDQCTERSTGGSPKTGSTHYYASNYTTNAILLSLTLVYCEIESLKLRRHNFQQKFFKRICQAAWELPAWSPPTWTWPFCSLRLRHPTV